MNYEEPIHRIIGGIVHSPAFADKLPQQREFYNLTPPEYWELLHAHVRDLPHVEGHVHAHAALA